MGNRLGSGSQDEILQQALLGQAQPASSAIKSPFLTGDNPANNVFGFSDQVAREGLAQQEAEKRNQQVSNVYTQAIEAYKAGDPKTAISILAQVNPKVMEDQLAKDLGVDQAIRQKVGEATMVPESDIQKFEDGSIYEVVGTRGNKKARNLLQGTIDVKSSKEKPLSDKQITTLEDAAGAVDSIRGLADFGTKLIQQGKVGPLTGRGEEIINALDLASPQSASYQNLRRFITLGLAKQQQGGKPSDVDQKAVERIISSVKSRPETLIYTLAGLQANIEADQARNATILNQSATSEQSGPVSRGIKASGVNLQKAEKIKGLSQAAGIPEPTFRQGLILLNQFKAAPKMGIWKNPEIKALLDKTLTTLEKEGAEDLLD